MVATAETLPMPVLAEMTERALTVERLCWEIRELNPTAPVEWLAQFSAAALERYLAHLSAASEPRGRMARWMRPNDTPAILAFTPDDE